MTFRMKQSLWWRRNVQEKEITVEKKVIVMELLCRLDMRCKE